MTKVTYDLGQLDASFLPSLRTTLLTALQTFVSGPKSIIIQLSLAVSGLALQFPAWQDTAVQDMVETFGKIPTTVPVMLEFLTVFPEEISTNSRIPLTVSTCRKYFESTVHQALQDEEFAEGTKKLLSDNAARVVSLLVMYLTATGM